MAIPAVQESVDGGSVQEVVSNTNEEELQGDTLAPQALSLSDKISIQSDSGMSIKSLMCCQPRTREQISL